MLESIPLVPQLAASRILTIKGPNLAPLDVSPPQKLEFGAGAGWLIAMQGGIIQTGTIIQDYLLRSHVGMRLYINDEDEIITDGMSAAFANMNDLFSEDRGWLPMRRYMIGTDNLFVIFKNFSLDEIFIPTVTFAFLRDRDLRGVDRMYRG